MLQGEETWKPRQIAAPTHSQALQIQIHIEKGIYSLLWLVVTSFDVVNCAFTKIFWETASIDLPHALY